jgi:hypothetical protein
MGLDQIANYFAQTAAPQMTKAAFPDRLTIRDASFSAGPGGGRIKAQTPDQLADIPAKYSPLSRHEGRDTVSGQMTSFEHYVVAFATHKDGQRIDLDQTKHRLIIQARGNEPEKTFRIISVRDQSGIMFEVVCEKEN